MRSINFLEETFRAVCIAEDNVAPTQFFYEVGFINISVFHYNQLIFNVRSYRYFDKSKNYQKNNNNIIDVGMQA